MGLVEYTAQFGILGNIGTGIAGAKMGKIGAGIGALGNMARGAIQRHKTQKELMEKGVDRDKAKKLAKKEHGGLLGNAMKGAAVGAGVGMIGKGVVRRMV